MQEYWWKFFRQFEFNASNTIFFGIPNRLKHVFFWLIVHVLGATLFYAWQEHVFGRHKITNCSKWVAAAACFGYRSRYQWPAECFADGTIDLPFEYLTVKVPAHYERMLELTYGNWRQFVKGDAMHSGLVLDASVPYQVKIQEIRQREGIT